ncbi:uncharacterized protein LOC101859861 [Aplysia californica]|uniref:Uncharacterized protein LOC101859861 n=1 Tax=Aplysia californica TaxID=6500 RepID=A0ABM1A138_APLCA|nr:uncharacterized protein LOC101859861 [Aplysia californica]
MATQTKYYTESQNGDLQKEANDKGYKKRIRTNLIEATRGSSIEELEKAMEKFRQNRLEDCGDLTKAQDRMDFLTLKRDLRDAIRRSHVGVLERTIAEARGSRYEGQLGPQIQAAEAKLAHLRELNKYSHDILAMDQQTISEIHSYHRPPACVHDVMAASYMLLGYDESQLRDWSYLQAMAGRLGRGSLIHQVREFDSSDVDEPTAKRVREILDYHELSEVRAASNGAATFHVWADNIVDKISKDNSNEEDRRRREEEERSRREGGSSRTPVQQKQGKGRR